MTCCRGGFATRPYAWFILTYESIYVPSNFLLFFAPYS